MIVQAGSLCVLLVVLIGALVKSEPGPRPRSTPIFTNQFAVHVPDGADAAAEIADNYGFDNYGQVRSTQNLRQYANKVSFIANFHNTLHLKKNISKQ
ncbi:unnamed protein product [Xylocopa violacea]|uniref:Peptidase S8 pro-domain domain-containing protein n=1 Tax=Xylocopa violacea TaxID=135666 RepID=A0ABP1P7K1_XYLVO